DPDTAIKDINKITVENLKKYHQDKFGTGSMVLVFVGDVDHKELDEIVSNAFGPWKESEVKQKKESELATKASGKVYVSMQDKTSTDFLVGTPLLIDRFHPDYLPLYLGTYALGGNFSARLMQTVRVKEGLTYGINSSLSGFGNRNDGYWLVGGTFSPNLLPTGESSTMREINSWSSGGISQKELDTVKTTLTGNYSVGFDTTGGLAAGILSSIETYNDLKEIDQYPFKVNAVTLEQVNEAIKKYIKTDNLYQVAAGSIDKDGKPFSDNQ
ncbi:MAG: insulinase family protein, partial [Flammeovirgaceae bacterium TMED290]